MGVEVFDAEGKISLRKLVGSKIFTVFALPYIQGSNALPLIYLLLTRLPVAGSVQAALYVIAILIGGSTFNLYWTILYMRHSIRHTCCMEKHCQIRFASALWTVILFLLPTTTTLLSTIAKAIAGFAIYVVFIVSY